MFGIFNNSMHFIFIFVHLGQIRINALSNIYQQEGWVKLPFTSYAALTALSMLLCIFIFKFIFLYLRYTHTRAHTHTHKHPSFPPFTHTKLSLVSLPIACSLPQRSLGTVALTCS